MTDLRSEPPERSQEAWAWRRSWTRTPKSTPQAVLAGSQTRVRKVHHRVVLEIRALARDAHADVGSQDRAVPDAGALRDGHVAD
jgi:hypothetical protein